MDVAILAMFIEKIGVGEGTGGGWMGPSPRHLKKSGVGGHKKSANWLNQKGLLEKRGEKKKGGNGTCPVGS